MVVIAAVALVAAAPAGSALPSSDWSQFRGGPARQGANIVSSQITPANVSTLAPAWAANPGGSSSSPAVVGGVVYSGAWDQRLHAFDATSGRPLWSSPTGGVNSSSPAVAGNMVAVTSTGGKLDAFNAATGQLLWMASVGDGIEASPVVAGGVVYNGSLDGKLYAFDAAGIIGCSGMPKTCLPLWTAATGGPITSTAAVADGKVHVASDRLYTFDAAGLIGCGGSPRTCAPLWTAATGDSADSSPAVTGGTLYIGSYDGRLYAFDAAGLRGCGGSPRTCLPLWSADVGVGVFSSPAVAGGFVYAGSFIGQRLLAFDATGVNGCSGIPKVCLPLWTSVDLGREGISSPAAVDGLVFIGGDGDDGDDGSGRIQAFDAAGDTGCSGIPKICTPLWTGPTAGNARSSPAVVGRMVYVASDDGTLNAFAIPAAPDLAAGRFQPLEPARVLDTRIGTGGPGSPIGPGATTRIPLTGRGGIPVDGVSAVALNATVTEPTANGYLTTFPSGTDRPLASSLNFRPGQTVANLIVVPLESIGSLDVFNAAGTTHVVLDVAGWFADAGAGSGTRYHPTVPARIVDSRTGTGGLSAPVGPGSTVNLPVNGRGGVPLIGASAVVLNATATQPTASGYLTVFPFAADRPLASNLNFVPGQTVTNVTVVPVGPDGSVNVFNAFGTTHLILDVVGWFGTDGTSGSRFTPLGPVRVVDSRIGTGGPVAPLGPGMTRTVPVAGRGGVPPTGATAVALNVTAAGPTMPSYLTIHPSGTVRPLASNLVLAPGAAVANLAVAPLGPDGAIDVFNAYGTTDLILDLVGWFGADGA